MAARIKSFSRTLVWILMGFLMLGLAGFGATNITGQARTVASVGGESVSVDAYSRELQREIRAIEAGTGTPLPMSRVREMGLDQQVLRQLVTLAAIDNETTRMGISIGDETLGREVMNIEAFQGSNGRFDRDAYRFALQQAGLRESEFEQDLRNESARTMLQAAIIAGVGMPPLMGETITGYLAERRSFSWAALGDDDLVDPLPEPEAADLKTWYDEHQEDFSLPETKRLTYVLLSPLMLRDEIDVDEEALHRLYDERASEFRQPERRLVERLVFPDESAAKSARAQLETGGTTFESLVQSRGLDLADVDLGDMTREDLGEAAQPVFDAEINDVVGPLPSSLGPALYRVNGRLEAHEVPFDEVQGELRDELVRARAARLIESRTHEIDDMLAAGATLEELAEDAGMEIGTIDWTRQSSDGVAGYEAFRDAAAEVSSDDYPEIAELEDGSIFAIELEEVLPPRPEPFEDARARVAGALKAQLRLTALREQGEAIIATLGEDAPLSDSDLDVQSETGLTRSAYLEAVPDHFMGEVFAMEPGETRVIAGNGKVAVVQLDEVLPPADSDDLAALRDRLGGELDQALANALFEALARDALARANPKINERALSAVQSSFR
ncbi:SurA N-terminal domain-containing protein [Pontibaca methylaminivorans]|uniref:Peptidyl-prolyl cis-trans isomerase D n=1 Tax=Pontibaca methylaminivorans TaxID=515897 RepID=A0A1R3X047_9RHOB|nr:peptidyl-prolyl cis-trans isomerase [Pontibaca methylaminivorans]SIT84185.1 peptidyl-prolyl cis-trans isomerase D [Pontibaca methylaminivorans]